MLLYSVIILAGTAVIALCNALYPPAGFGPLYAVLASAGSTAAVILLDGLFAFLLRRLPARLFSHERAFFNVSLAQKRRYEKIGIRKWKDRIPELGCFTHFSKRKIAAPHDNEYVGRYLLEACYGQVIHLITAFTGFLIVFLLPLRHCYRFGIPVAFVNAVLNLLPFFVLRYNTYKLKILYRRNTQKAERAVQQTTPQNLQQPTV